MNVFFRELRSYKKGLFFWSLGMIALVGSGMAKFAAYSSTSQSISSLIGQFPKSVQTIFGLTGFDLTKASGFFGVLFIYISLMATVHAVLLGADIISKEERDRTSEFLFVKPISRGRVITAKLLAGLVNLGLLNLVTLASSIYFVNFFGSGQAPDNDILVLMAGLFFLQLLFFFMATAVAGLTKRPKTAASLATAVLLVCFMLTFITGINQALDWLKYLTPFKYFDARNLLASASLDPFYVLLSLGLIMVMIAVTYRAYQSRDLAI